MRAFLAALLLSASVLAQGNPFSALLERAGHLASHPTAKALEGHQVKIAPAVTSGIGSVKVFAFLQTATGFHSAQVFPGAGSVFKVPKIDRIAFEATHQLGPLHVRTSLHYDQGAHHVEGSTLFLNSESKAPVGALKPVWMGLGVDDGLGTFYVRGAVPLGLEPLYYPGDQNLSTWKLAHLPGDTLNGACLAPVPWGISFGDWPYLQRLVAEPDPIRLKGEFLIPAPVHTQPDIRNLLDSAKSQWLAFQDDRRAWTDPSYLFGEVAFTGQAGSQSRLGKHPCMETVNPHLLSGYDADRLRCVTMYVEGRRKYWLDWPLVRSDDPNSAYNFYGLHWSSRWLAGYTRTAPGSSGTWVPPMGRDHGVSGHNLEHLRSRLPELALYLQDPQLMWMTSRLAALIYSTIGDPAGPYYGCGFTTLRGYTRPWAELLECVVALESFGNVYKDEAKFYRDHLKVKADWLQANKARFEKKPTRPDEQVPGHHGEEITETWQTGIGGDYFYVGHLLYGWESCLELATTSQAAHVIGWRGDSVLNLEMPKQALATDWTIGSKYHKGFDGLVTWNRSLIDIPDLAGIDQDRRTLIVRAIDSRYPKARFLEWGNGPWAGFAPRSAQPRRAWYQ